MMDSIRKSRLATLGIIILCCVLVFWVQWNASELLAPLHLQSKSLVRYILKCMLSLIPVTIVLFILHRPSAIIETLGLRDSVLRGLLFGFSIYYPFIHRICHHRAFQCWTYLALDTIFLPNSGGVRRNLIQGFSIWPIVQSGEIRVLLGGLFACCPVRSVSHLSR